MSLLIRGLKRLSELTIDADKDWQGRGITNLKQVAAAMTKGCLLVRGDNYLIRLVPGAAGQVLTSQGAGKLPTWAPAAGNLKYYFPVDICLSDTVRKVTVDQSVARIAGTGSTYIKTLTDDVAGIVKRLAPEITLPRSVAEATPDETIAKTPGIASEGGVQLLIDGAVADDGGVQTEETIPAREGTASDMTLLPAAPAVDDAYYFGAVRPFDRVWLNIGQAGVGNWTWVLEYWNGAAWVACVEEYDLTGQFTKSGPNSITHAPQGDWAACAVDSLTLYWIRVRVTAYNNITTQPRGTQCWFEVLG